MPNSSPAAHFYDVLRLKPGGTKRGNFLMATLLHAILMMSLSPLIASSDMLPDWPISLGFLTPGNPDRILSPSDSIDAEQCRELCFNATKVSLVAS